MANQKFLFPLFLLGILAFTVPLLIAYLSQKLGVFILGQVAESEEYLDVYLSTYPIFLLIISLAASLVFVRKAVDKWRDSVRDEIYLVGEVLHNLDESER